MLYNLSTNTQLAIPVVDKNLELAVVAYIYPVDSRTLRTGLDVGLPTETKPRDSWDSIPQFIPDISAGQVLAAQWVNWRITKVELNKTPQRRSLRPN